MHIYQELTARIAKALEETGNPPEKLAVTKEEIKRIGVHVVNTATTIREQRHGFYMLRKAKFPKNPVFFEAIRLVEAEDNE